VWLYFFDLMHRVTQVPGETSAVGSCMRMLVANISARYMRLG
jgi:hypothetical protein